MTLITRLTKLLKADMHAVLDKVEEPSALLKQSIREMEDAIASDERQVRLWQCEQEQLVKKIEQLTSTLADLEDKGELCFKSQKDDLARAMVKRKLETLQAKTKLEETLNIIKENSIRLSSQLIEQHEQLAEIKQKSEVLLDDAKTKAGDCAMLTACTVMAAVKEEDVEIAFLQEKQKWSNS